MNINIACIFCKLPASYIVKTKQKDVELVWVPVCALCYGFLGWFINEPPMLESKKIVDKDVTKLGKIFGLRREKVTKNVSKNTSRRDRVTK